MSITVQCPACDKNSLIVGGSGNGNPKCSQARECGYTETPEHVAGRYASSVLGWDDKDGSDLVVSGCPDCETETLVDCARGTKPAIAFRFICFRCAQTWKDSELMYCDGARRNPHWTRPYDDAAVCNSCLSNAWKNDD